MPTPFMHMQLTEALKAQVIASESSHLVDLLEREWPAFYLGCVAPDVQTINGVARAVTHFYDTPPVPEGQAYPEMLAQYPQLAGTAVTSPAQAVFVAGYIFHLVLDLIWLRQILLPFFMESSDWGDFPARRRTHHTLLIHLDKLAFDSLPKTAAGTLASAQPQAWLPFVTDADLIAWRDYLVTQMLPGAQLQTIAVYAGRLKMPPEKLAANLMDGAWMAENVFQHVPVDEINRRLQAAVPHCIRLISDYLGIEDQDERLRDYATTRLKTKRLRI